MSWQNSRISMAAGALLRPHTPQGGLIRAFILMIILGTAALALPCCQARPVSLSDCFFIAVSAVCVTGLCPLDFSVCFTPCGQAVTLTLMQLGGLGVLTFAALAFRVVGAQISLSSQAALTDSVMQKDAAGEFREIFGKIVVLLLGLEAAGAVLMVGDLWLGRGAPLPQAMWQGAFHAVSAFCNAGFTLWDNSLAGQDAFFCVIIMLLIFCGGIGQVAMVEIAGFFSQLLRPCARAPRSHFSYNTKVVLIISCAMVALGLLTLLIMTGISGRTLPFFPSLFHAVSARTAGFTCFSTDCLTRPDKLVTIFLMFVGGSPGSCAGGIKTTALAIWLATVYATLRNREEYTFLGRQIPKLVVEKARKLIQFTIIWNIFGVFLLCLTEGQTDVLTLIFEQVSAFGTVGLSLDYTPHLSEYGKLWICLCMFVGRIGPLTLALGITPLHPAKFAHPEGKIMIG